MSRIDRDQLFMQTAKLFSQRGTCPRAQVGAVIVRDRHIVSHGYNGAPPGMDHCEDVGCGGSVNVAEGVAFPNGCTRATHAEVNAIYFAARQGVPLKGSTLYSTHEPCLHCAMAIISAGIKYVAYATEYRIHDGLYLLNATGIGVAKWPLS